MKKSRFATVLTGSILLIGLLAACSSLIDEPPTATTALTPRPGKVDDDATTGAISRSTREAQATRNAEATLNADATAKQQSVLASQTALKLTQIVEARVTGDAVFAAKSHWPRRISESFRDNSLGWPLGVTTDQSPVVTSSIANGGYLWSVVVPHGNSYINLIPKNGSIFSSLYASVTVEFLVDDAGDQTSYGLVFRNVDKDYGFFGISKSGDFRILEVHGSGIYSLDQESSEFIHTDAGESNRIAVVAVGPDFVFLINDQVVGQMNAELDAGQIGLGVDALNGQEQAQVKFSDFEVDAP